MPGFLSNRDRLRDEADGKSREVAEFYAAVHSLGLPEMESADLAAELQARSVNGNSFDRYSPASVEPGPALRTSRGS